MAGGGTSFAAGLSCFLSQGVTVLISGLALTAEIEVQEQSTRFIKTPVSAFPDVLCATNGVLIDFALSTELPVEGRIYSLPWPERVAMASPFHSKAPWDGQRSFQDALNAHLKMNRWHLQLTLSEKQKLFYSEYHRKSHLCCMPCG